MIPGLAIQIDGSQRLFQPDSISWDFILTILNEMEMCVSCNPP